MHVYLSVSQGSIIKKAGFGAGSTERPTLFLFSNKLPNWELGLFVFFATVRFFGSIGDENVWTCYILYSIA